MVKEAFSSWRGCWCWGNDEENTPTEAPSTEVPAVQGQNNEARRGADIRRNERFDDGQKHISSKLEGTFNQYNTFGSGLSTTLGQIELMEQNDSPHSEAFHKFCRKTCLLENRKKNQIQHGTIWNSPPIINTPTIKTTSSMQTYRWKEYESLIDGSNESLRLWIFRCASS